MFKYSARTFSMFPFLEITERDNICFLHSRFIIFVSRSERELDSQGKKEVLIAIRSSEEKARESQKEGYLFLFFIL